MSGRAMIECATMAYTTDQLTAVETALASGTLRVEVNGRVVQYHSVGDLIKLRDLIRSELGTEVPNNARGRAWHPVTTRGL